jgi:uncharacterized damage-inducible protein DinB
MKKDSVLTQELKVSAIFRMEENLRMVKKSLAFLDEADLWKRPNEASNSIGNILLHLCGNIAQYILSGLGETEDIRLRDAEFASEGGYSKADLTKKLEELLLEVKGVIRGLEESQLTGRYQVQGFDLTGAGILLHVVEHFSYHTGQIAFWVKILSNRDLDFYAGFDLNKKNKS